MKRWFRRFARKEPRRLKSIPNLEIHVAHTCNLACESCSHYSDQGHSGVLSLAEADRWMHPWSKRISPNMLSLLGGEPTIHPELPEFVTLARRHWPDAHLRLATNGFFLHRHPSLPAVLQNVANAGIYLSIHHNAPEYEAKLRPILDLLKGWYCEYGIKVEIVHSYAAWTRRYHGSGDAMEPFSDGQPRQSWEQCTAKYCPQIFEGKIWKCGPLAYLRLQAAKYRLSGSWKPYLQYLPLEPGCSDEQLAEFFQREDESSCGMCAANPAKLKLPIPIRSASASASMAPEIRVEA